MDMKDAPATGMMPGSRTSSGPAGIPTSSSIRIMTPPLVINEAYSQLSSSLQDQLQLDDHPNVQHHSSVTSNTSQVVDASSVSYSNTSASEETEEESVDGEDDSNADSDEEELNTRLEKPSYGKPRSGWTGDEPGDLLLHSLEPERYGPSVQYKLISLKGEDEDFPFGQKAKLDSKEKEKDADDPSSDASGRPAVSKNGPIVISSHGRTIKAATRHIDAQGRRALSRLQSHSMNDLTNLSAPPSPCASHNVAHTNPTASTDVHGCSSFLDPNSLYSFDKQNVPSVAVKAVIESQMDFLQKSAQESISSGPKFDTRRKNRRHYKEKALRFSSSDGKALAELNENESLSAGDLVENERKISQTSQFNCLPSRPIYQSSSRLASSASMKSLSLQAPDCPSERIQFYKSLIQILRTGKVKRGSDAYLANAPVPAGGFVELVFKQELRDLIWLETKAWLANMTMIEMDSYLCEKRKKIPETIHKILKFDLSLHQRSSRSESIDAVIPSNIVNGTYKGPEPRQRSSTLESKSSVSAQNSLSSNPPDGAASHSAASGNASDSHDTPDLRAIIDQDTLAASVAAKLFESEGSTVDGENGIDRKKSIPTSTPTNADDENCTCSETLSRLCQNCVDKETEAIIKVDEVLEELYEVEHLYPCSRALAHDYPVYVSEQVTSRLRSLYLFINVTRDLREKTNLMAKMFMIQNRAAAGWPVYDSEHKDFSSDSCEATPEIRTQDCSGYSYKMNTPASNFGVAKQVHFRSPVARSEAHGSCSDHTISAPESPEVQTPQAVEVFETSTSSLASSSGYNSANGVNYQSKENPFFKQRPSIYRKYVDKALKHKGLKQIYAQLSGILRPLLYRVHAALKKPTSYADGVATTTSTSANQTLNVHNGANFEQRSILSAPLSREYCEELSHYGVWSLAYQQMALPTFHRPFLFLLRVTVDVVHECLRTRLEQQPEHPSAVSIGQLIKECKEVIKAGVQIRQRYVNLAQTVLGEGGSEVIEAQLDTFDDDLKTMLQIYLKYLEMRMQFIQKLAPVSANPDLVLAGIGSSMSLRLKAHLEEEWNFVRLFCPHIPGGEALAANKFCCMSSNFLSAICESIETGIGQCLESFNESLETVRMDATGFRKGILSCCRRFKAVFQEASARACQATAFAKTLRKDLEIAAEFKSLVDPQTLCKKLRETGHIRIIAPNSMNHLIFVPNYLQANETSIWQLVDMICGGRNLDVPAADHDSGGYLIVFLCRENDIQWFGPVVVLEPTAEATISLSHIEVDGVLFVVNHPSQLLTQSRSFGHLMIGALQIDKMQTACNLAIGEALNDLKAEALEIQNKISHSLNLIYDQLDMNRVPLNDINEQDRLSLQSRCLEVTHLGFKFGFEYEKSLTRLITGERKTQLGRQLISFALQWMKFVVTKCEKGRGLRTRWTNQGLLYLMVALEPQYLQILNDSEFEMLKKQLDACMTHLIGSSDRSSKLINSAFLAANKPAYSVLAPAPTNKPLASSLNFHRSQSVSSAFNERAISMLLGAVQDAQTGNNDISSSSKGTRLEEWDKAKGKWKFHSTSNLQGLTNGEGQRELSPLERIRGACEQLESKRAERLRDRGAIGHVSDVVIQRAPLHITARKVGFQWQRGFKIGEGRFGKVYTAVNNKTGELIAMKEIKLAPNDHRAVKEAIDEIRTFEGIKHPHIVRYFGVEIHREEMYIFMEYCNEGSLESAAQLHMPEHLVRKYTRQLLDAVNCLHENGIVHRDIKSANIFLSSDGNLKLGDFGCCAKLKNHTTMPGEINAFVGTPAYMAPEVFTRTPVEGHGRAADIWSVGCVVLEMLCAKRPWPDLDNSYQIMFRVGMGEAPEIPDDLPEEGQDFIHRCLQHDPRLRWSASQLLGHPFTKVSEDEDL